MTRAILFLIALVVSAAGHAQVNKCIGANGRVTYTQDPCPANTTSEMIGRAVPAAPTEASAPRSPAGKAGSAKDDGPKTPAEQEQAFRRRQQEEAKAEKEAAQKAAQAERKQNACRDARERLATFEAGGRITRFNAEGERYYLDDAQIEQEKAGARQAVAQLCN